MSRWRVELGLLGSPFKPPFFGRSSGIPVFPTLELPWVCSSGEESRGEGWFLPPPGCVFWGVMETWNTSDPSHLPIYFWTLDACDLCLSLEGFLGRAGGVFEASTAPTCQPASWIWTSARSDWQTFSTPLILIGWKCRRHGNVSYSFHHDLSCFCFRKALLRFRLGGLCTDMRCSAEVCSAKKQKKKAEVLG